MGGGLESRCVGRVYVNKITFLHQVGISSYFRYGCVHHVMSASSGLHVTYHYV